MCIHVIEAANILRNQYEYSLLHLFFAAVTAAYVRSICLLNFPVSNRYTIGLGHDHKRFSKTVSVDRKSIFSDSTVPAPWKSVTACRFSIQIFSTFLQSPDYSETSFRTLSSCPNRFHNPFVGWAHLIFGQFFMPPASKSPAAIVRKSVKLRAK